VLETTSRPGTDDWWVMELAADFGRDLPRLSKLKSYSDGTNALPDETDQSMREAYRRFIHSSRLNMADLVVSSKVARLKVRGFRTAAPGDTNGDAAAWATWKRSGMKVGQRDFLKDAGIYGSAYLTTTGPRVPSPTASPLVIPSSGWTTATREYTLQPWKSEAALTVGYDPINQVELLTLFRPGYMRQAFRRALKSSVPSGIVRRRWTPGRDWDWVSDPVPLGYTSEVPVFKYSGADGKGMFEKHLDTLDRITIDIRDRLTITAMQAFRQRGIQPGDDKPLPQFYPADHPQAGQPINYDEIYKAGPAALWNLPPGAKMWESTVTEITPLLEATKDDTKALASTTSTPIYILSPDAANASAEGAKAGGEAFADSVEEWRDRAEMPIASSISTSFLAQGDLVRAEIGELEPIWGPTTRTSLQEQASAASQAKASGMPQRMIDEKIWGFSPAEIEQARQDRMDDAFEAAAS